MSKIRWIFQIYYYITLRIQLIFCLKFFISHTCLPTLWIHCAKRRSAQVPVFKYRIEQTSRRRHRHRKTAWEWKPFGRSRLWGLGETCIFQSRRVVRPFATGGCSFLRISILMLQSFMFLWRNPRRVGFEKACKKSYIFKSLFWSIEYNIIFIFFFFEKNVQNVKKIK